MKTKNCSTRKIAEKCVFTALILFFIAYIAFLFVFNCFFNEIYDTPKAVKGVADYDGVPLSGRLTAFSLSGEWEFFYNRWIVTDGDAGENDGYIAVPGRWTGKILNGEKLTRHGYASYRLTVKNPAGDIDISSFTDNSAVPVRVFVNGELNSACGTLSKIPGESRSGQSEKLAFYPSTGEDLVIVVETGCISSGGLTHAPFLSTTAGPSAYWIFWEKFVLIMAGLSAGMFLAALVMAFGSFRYEKDVTMPLLTGMLCLHFFLSKDVAKAFGLYGYGAVCIPALITGFLTVVVYAARILKSGGALNKKTAIAGGVAAVAACTAYGALFGTVYVVIPAILFIAAGLLPLYPLLTAAKLTPLQKAVYAGIYFTTLCILAFEITDGAGLFKFGTEYVFSVLLTAVIAAQCIITFKQHFEQSQKLLRMNALERELEAVKQRALSTQIKPHFIFNSLTAIQSLYRKNTDEGERALKSFSSHLRQNINAADGEELIPFNEEVKNVLNYFELENLRADGALTLLLDLNETDFYVPVLSIQPLVENAVKHGGTQFIKNGYISFSSNEVNGEYIITVSDNGKGFDESTHVDGVGIKNVTERFKRLLNAELKIRSATGRGTEATVVIPQKEQNE